MIITATRTDTSARTTSSTLAYVPPHQRIFALDGAHINAHWPVSEERARAIEFLRHVLLHFGCGAAESFLVDLFLTTPLSHNTLIHFLVENNQNEVFYSDTPSGILQ